MKAMKFVHQIETFENYEERKNELLSELFKKKRLEAISLGGEEAIDAELLQEALHEHCGYENIIDLAIQRFPSIWEEYPERWAWHAGGTSSLELIYCPSENAFIVHDSLSGNFYETHKFRVFKDVKSAKREADKIIDSWIEMQKKVGEKAQRRAKNLEMYKIKLNETIARKLGGLEQNP